MSLVLTSSGEKLEITAGTIIPFTVHYADYVGATPLFTPGVAAGDTINGTKDLLAAPASGQRVVRTISVHNDSGGADTVTVQIDDGGTNYTVIPATLANGYTLYYDEDGWKVLDGSGALLTVLPTHAVLGPHHSDAATDAVTRGSIIVGNATPAWDELVYPGTARHLQTNATDVTWAQNITMADDAWIGQAAGPTLTFDDTLNALKVTSCNIALGDAHDPSCQLHLKGTSREIRLERTDNATYQYLQLVPTGALGAANVIWTLGRLGNEDFFRLSNWNGSTTTLALAMLANGNIGIGTTAPGQILDCNSGSGNMIADGYDSHPSWLALKVDPQPMANVLTRFKQVVPYEYKRIPHVSADELARAAIAEFGQERWDKLFPDGYREGKVKDIPDPEVQAFVDNLGDQLRTERAKLPKWQRKHYGLVIDDLVTTFPDVVSRNDDGEVTGYSLNNYVGLLHACITELVSRVEHLEAK